MPEVDPIPSIEILEDYERLIPGSAGSLVSQFIAYGEHRRTLQLKKMDFDFKLQQREQRLQECGQVFAFVITMTALGSGLWLALGGAPWPGSLLSGTTVISIVIAFIKTRQAPQVFIGEGSSTKRGTKSERSSKSAS